MFKVIFLGDIISKEGRAVVKAKLPKLREDLAADLVVANVDNASGGFGLNKKHYAELGGCGVDVFTGGDHIWDKPEILPLLETERRLLRPANYPAHLPGTGVFCSEIAGKRIVVIHIMGQVFMKHNVEDPFSCMEKLLEEFRLGENCETIIVDFHAEATAEKMAMGHFLDGRVSVVVGTHTHIPTADACILGGGTGYQTDAGMCGDYNSVIGMDKSSSIGSFVNKVRLEKFAPVNNINQQKNTQLRGLFAEINPSGHVTTLFPIALIAAD